MMMIGVISIITTGMSVMYVCRSCHSMYQCLMCAFMCTSIILSGHIEGKGQGGDFKGMGQSLTPPPTLGHSPAQAISSKAIKRFLFSMLDTYHRQL